MANICTNNIDLFASAEAITWLNEQIQNIRTAENQSQAFAEVFRLEEFEPILDTLGPKWVTITDWDRREDTEYYLNLESAYYFPKELVERMVFKLQSISEGYNVVTNMGETVSAMSKGRYFDEGFETVGVFECFGLDNTDTAEGSVDEDQDEWEEENPDGFFWDEVVEPIFEELEGDL